MNQGDAYVNKRGCRIRMRRLLLYIDGIVELESAKKPGKNV